ncbi:type III PLP-dependent enzyme [Lentzea sp. HUAS12]|uniref:type III PLP-dependent enzyme n=1 Tax=Lentzea sp. HUAS12 TaxID=2951806 RepID=UPI0020A11634|nr:type III PLP-dependent enzyme [Lentzea sp. HUAS12]USX53716.1 type III PLP-dependent enzyme [Lentzea sp. HUAS12]
MTAVTTGGAGTAAGTGTAAGAGTVAGAAGEPGATAAGTASDSVAAAAPTPAAPSTDPHPTPLAERIAELAGTPAYVYDLDAVEAAHTDLRRALPHPSVLYYSLKANPHPAVVGTLARLGCRAEVSSDGEVDAALQAGVPPAQVLLTGPGKSAAVLEHALGLGVTRFSVDSPTDLRAVGESAARHGVEAKCLLRVNADEGVAGTGLTMTGTASQFGADASWVAADPESFLGHAAATVTGLHLYMGSNFVDEDALLRQFEVAVDLATSLAGRLGRFEEVDLGGGFGAPYAHRGVRPRFPGLAARLSALLDRRLPGWRDGAPRIAFESGRHLVGDSGVLVTRVVDVKRSKGELFVVLDTGVNHLGGMSGLRRLPRLAPDVVPVGGREPGEVTATLVGPLCTPLDTLGRGLRMPAVRPGDLVVVPNVGAYGLTASLIGFLGHTPPAEVVVRGDSVLDVSRLRLVRGAGQLPVHSG